MDFFPGTGAFRAALILSCSVVAYAGSVVSQPDSDSPVALSPDYQLRRLNTPTPAELAAEKRGSVYIYDSLEAEEVEKALDQHYDRIQNMMFVRVHHLPPTGAGEAVVEDGDCK